MTSPIDARTLRDPSTPFAVVDEVRARGNVERLRRHLEPFGVTLRPHVKTAKSLAVTRLIQGDGPGPITVSTLREAEVFADAGYRDISYAVGIDPHKLPRVIALLRRGVMLSVLLDSAAQAAAVTAMSAETGTRVPALIEIDCDGHRGGVRPDDPLLPRLAAQLAAHGCLAGVLVHAGESYFAATPEAQRAAAQHERDVAVAAAQRIRDAGYPVPAVSVGSTPTAHAATDLSGVTEVRAGNYVFFDLVMAGIGVCAIDDIALSVVVTVIGHQPERGWVLTDGGWMAMSRDRGTANQARDQGYGLVAELSGQLIDSLVMTGASQEHGVIQARDGAAMPPLPIGTRLRVFPNHACATAAQHAGYQVIGDATNAEGDPVVRDFWARITGW